ncbi:MAG: ligase-associated DNA damage response endonuclease PdeM [Caulobacterales bacterium]
MSAAPSPRYEIIPSPCGGVALAVGQAEALLRVSGALWLAGERVLIVADLHLEKGSAYAARGQLLPPYDTRETLARLAAEAAQLMPRAIVLLGDTFHDATAEERLPDEAIRTLTTIGAITELVWVVGNHDADGPRNLPGEVVASWDVDGLRLVHEPAAGACSGEVAGHLHPCARIKGRGASVRRRCFITDGERIILPAFGAFAGGLNVRDAAFGRLFAQRPLAVALGERRAHPVGWEQLGGD